MEQADRVQLERDFHDVMLEGYRRAKAEAGYNATYFIQSVQNRGGLATARSLLHAGRTSDGFTSLYLKQRLDLTVEALICDTPAADQWPAIVSSGMPRAGACIKRLSSVSSAASLRRANTT